MAGIRQRKRHLIGAGLMGAALAGIPLFIGLLIFFYKSAAAQEQIREYQEREKGIRTYQVQILNTDKLRGEIIEKKDIQTIEVMGKSDSQMIASAGYTAGMTVRFPIPAGTVLSDSLVTKDVLPEKDLRAVEFTYIELPAELGQNDIIDVRIAFPNGEDYVVVSNKQVMALKREDTGTGSIPEMMELQVGESELLRLSSAKTDMEQIRGTRVYAVRYIEEGQEKGEDTYPVNPYIYELGQWNPNLIRRLSTEANIHYRNVLEENLRAFFQEKDKSYH